MSDSPAVSPAEVLPPPPAVAPGKLLVVATPIGNLGDLSPRAAEALRSADIVVCEDTRTSRYILDKVESRAAVASCHEHNEVEVSGRIADLVAAGKTVALVTDAGTPAISDPGFRVTRECRKRGLAVSPIPGPCSAIVALSASGLPSDRFLFVGFLPPKLAARRAFLEEHKNSDATIIVLESCHRIERFLDDIVEVLGPQRVICSAREITKLHETILTGPVGEVRARVLAGMVKGEFVVLIAKDGFAL